VAKTRLAAYQYFESKVIYSYSLLSAHYQLLNAISIQLYTGLP